MFDENCAIVGISCRWPDGQITVDYIM